MISIRSSADLARALAGPIDAPLRRALEERRDQLMEDVEDDLGELVHIIVVRPGDTLTAVEEAAAFPVITGVDGDGPAYEFVERHGGWLEAVTVLSDSGFGVALFVPDTIETDPDILLPVLAQL